MTENTERDALADIVRTIRYGVGLPSAISSLSSWLAEHDAAKDAEIAELTAEIDQLQALLSQVQSLTAKGYPHA